MPDNNSQAQNPGDIEDVIASDLLGGDVLNSGASQPRPDDAKIVEGGITDISGTVPLGGSSDVGGTGDALASGDVGATTGAGALGPGTPGDG